jgi:hypothetical protein
MRASVNTNFSFHVLNAWLQERYFALTISRTKWCHPRTHTRTHTLLPNVRNLSCTDKCLLKATGQTPEAEGANNEQASRFSPLFTDLKQIPFSETKQRLHTRCHISSN